MSSGTFLETTGHWSKAWNAKRSSVLTKELRNRRADVEAQYAAWISAGYTIYDIPANGGLTYLSAKAPGKYLCVWKTLAPAYLSSPATGTAQAGAATTITLAAGASAIDNYYNGMVIELTAGTGSGQFNIITAYNGTTKVATVKTWGVNPANDSVYKIGDYDIISAGDVSIHTSVIVTGIVLNSGNLIINSNPELRIGMDTDNGDYDGLVFEYMILNDNTFNVITLGSKILNVTFLNIRYKTDGLGTNYIYKDPNLNNVYIEDMGIEIDCTISKTYENIYHTSVLPEYRYLRLNITNCTMTIKNYQGLYSQIQLVGISGTKICNFDNVFTYGITDSGNVVASTGYEVIYLSPNSLPINTLSLTNYIIKRVYPERNIFIDDNYTQYTLDLTDTTGIMTDANYSSLDTLITSSNRNIRLTGNQYSQRFYETSFVATHEVDEKFKTMFAREQSLLIVWREDLDAVFVTDTGGARKVKNLQLYENDGTTAYDYRNNEHFLILAEDADGVETVFAWYQGLVYGTYFADFWDDTTYTIKRIFQILEPPESLSWRNILPYNNSPIECSASFKELVSVFVDAL